MTDPHPSGDALADFAEGRVAAAEEERVRAHLAACATCREVVDDLRSYPDLDSPGPDYRVGRDEVRARLEELRSAVTSPRAARGAGAAPATPRRPVPRRPAPHRHRLAWAAVAILAVAVGLYLGLQVRGLREELRASAAPWPNVVVASLLPEDDPLRSAESPALPIDSGLSLVVSDDEPFPSGTYRAEVLAPDGSVVLRIDALRPDASGSLLFHLPPGTLAPGSYRIVLHRAGAGEWPRRFALKIAP